MDDDSLRLKLLELVEFDQKDLTDLGITLRSVNNTEEKISIIRQTATRCQIRAEKMIKLLENSGIKPAISKIGEEASCATILLALHSYPKIMRAVSEVFHDMKKDRPQDVPVNYLATLVDRIEIIDSKTQKLGTVNYIDEGVEYLVPIKNSATLNDRRSEYGLEAIDLDKVKQKAMNTEQYRLSFAFMDRRII